MDNIPVSITFTIGNWGRIVTLLSKMPFDQVADVISTINQQVSAAVQRTAEPQQGMQSPNGNGVAHAPKE